MDQVVDLVWANHRSELRVKYRVTSLHDVAPFD